MTVRGDLLAALGNIAAEWKATVNTDSDEYRTLLCNQTKCLVDVLNSGVLDQTDDGTKTAPYEDLVRGIT